MANGSTAKANLRRRAKRAHERAVRDTLRSAQRDANRDTGQMARSVTATPTTGTDRLTARIVVPDPGSPKQSDKARWTDRGTRPHVIRAKRGKVLVFKVGGRTVFAKQVQHPGYKGSGWFTNNVKRWPQSIRQAWRGSR